MILAIDPGTTQSAYVILDKDLHPESFDILQNEVLLASIPELAKKVDAMAIEMIASYGMPVGAETFETVFWIGRFWQEAWAAGLGTIEKVGRMEVKLNLCHSTKAKDANIRQALIDRFGEVGTAKNPGFFYGVKSHIWAAVAVGVTYADRLPFDEVVNCEE